MIDVGKKAKSKVMNKAWSRVCNIIKGVILARLWAKVKKKIRDRVLDMVFVIRRRVKVNVFLRVKAEDWDHD